MMVKCVNELDNKLDILILRILLKCTVMTHDILKKRKKREKKMHFEIFNLKLGQFHANPYFI